MGTSLQLFGVPKVVGIKTYDLPLDKPASLLFYLAQRSDWVSRSELAFLYRPDVPEETALANVRVFIYRAKQFAWTTDLEVEKFRLRFRVESDVSAFLDAFKLQSWERALQLYQGTFLSGLQVADTPAYETWLELERQSLNTKWRKAVLAYTEMLEPSGDFLTAEGWLEALLKADPLDEEALQYYLRVLISAGKRKQGRDAFEDFCQLLRAELDAEPLEATRALADTLMTQGVQSTPLSLNRPKHNLPAQTTRFIGRQRELASLSALLHGDTRLLTLVGLGGVGKTRLALEFATRQLETFQDGIWFVPLAGVSSPDLLVPSIASALGLAFTGTLEPKTQLLNFLREKALLVLLDNFEHLLEGAVLLEELLAQAPRLRLIVTSRVALELRAEWLVDVNGLAYPPAVTSEPLERFEAVTLFIQRAAQRSVTFVPQGETLAAVAELSRRVEGMPLALELAASWVRSLSVPQILSALDTTMDVLSSQTRDLPERQRQMRTVFDASWQRLSAQEQIALSRLSIFQGGFMLRAAEQVAGVNMALLLSLINRSLVKRDTAGRFQMHELLRQFALSHLSSDQTTRLEHAFSHYYLDLVSTQAPKLRSKAQRITKDLLVADVDNLRLAWGLAIHQQHWEQLDTALHGVHQLWLRVNLFEEGSKMLTQLLSSLSPAHPLTERLSARTRLRLGYFQVSLGAFADAKTNFTDAISILRRLKLSNDLGFALHELGHVIRKMGDLQEAEVYLKESLELARQLDSDALCTDVLFHLSLLRRDQGRLAEARDCLKECIERSNRLADDAQVAVDKAQLGVLILQSAGNIAEAREYMEQGRDLFRQLGNTDDESICIYNLGRLAYEQGNFSESKQLLQESLRLRRYLGSSYMQESVLSTLGEIARDEGHYQEAQSYFSQSLEISRQLQSPMGQMYALIDLGDIAKRRNDDAAATDYFKQALRLASTGTTPSGVLIEVLCGVAAHLQTRLPEEAYLAAAYLSRQAGISQHLKDKIQHLANDLASTLARQVTENLQSELKNLSLEALLTKQLLLLDAV